MMSFTMVANRGSRTSANRNACPAVLPCGPSLSATTSWVVNASRIADTGSSRTAGGRVVLCPAMPVMESATIDATTVATRTRAMTAR